MKLTRLLQIFVLSAASAFGAAEFHSAIADVRVPADWKQLASERDSVVFGPDTGRQQLVVNLRIERDAPKAADIPKAIMAAMRSAMTSYRRLYGDDLVFEDTFSATVEDGVGHVFATGFASSSKIRVAVQIEQRGSWQRTIGAYDATGLSEEPFRIWATALIEGIK